MLAGSGLTYEFINDRTVSVRPILPHPAPLTSRPARVNTASRNFFCPATEINSRPVPVLASYAP